MRSIGVVSLLLTNVLVNGLMPPQVSSTSSLGSRRAFLDASVAAVAFLPFLVMTPALAADGDTFEDLTMPTPEEIKVQEVRTPEWRDGTCSLRSFRRRKTNPLLLDSNNQAIVKRKLVTRFVLQSCSCEHEGRDTPAAHAECLHYCGVSLYPRLAIILSHSFIFFTLSLFLRGVYQYSLHDVTDAE